MNDVGSALPPADDDDPPPEEGQPLAKDLSEEELWAKVLVVVRNKLHKYVWSRPDRDDLAQETIARVMKKVRNDPKVAAYPLPKFLSYAGRAAKFSALEWLRFEGRKAKKE